MSGPIEAPWSLTSFCTDEDHPAPDVGLAISLPGGATLYVGEITKEQWEEAGEEAAALGSDCGAWIILWPSEESDGLIVGKAVDLQSGLEMIHAIHDAAKAEQP